MEKNLQRYDYKVWSSDGQTIGAMVRSSQVLSMDEIYNAIKNGTKLREYVEKIRSENDKKLQNELKKRIPAIEFQTITKGHRREDCVVAFTKYMSFDLDDEKLNYNEVKRIISSDKMLNPTLVFLSPRGKLKFIVRDESINDAATLKYHQMTIWAYLYGKYGYVVDTQCKDLVRLTFLSSDSTAYYNPTAKTNIDFKDGDEARRQEVDEIVGKICPTSIKYEHYANKVQYTTDAMRAFLHAYADLCVSEKSSVLNTYNDWYAFGNYLRAAFDDDGELLEVWDKCSCNGDGYDYNALARKIRYLTPSDPSSVFGFIYNRRRDEFTKLWILKKQKEYGIQTEKSYTTLN